MFLDCEYLEKVLEQKTPRQILKQFIDNPKRFGNIFPIFDVEVYRLIMCFVLVWSTKPDDYELFTMFANIIKKISRLARKNTSLRISVR